MPAPQTTPGGLVICPVVQFIVSQDGLSAVLLADHSDDGTGHCRVCSAGAQSGRHRYPCLTRVYADTASEVERLSARVRGRST